LFGTAEPARHPELRTDSNLAILLEGQTQHTPPGHLGNIRNGVIARPLQKITPKVRSDIRPDRPAGFYEGKLTLRIAQDQ
ncbi:hypothetical protein LPV64_15850, partial [Ralstonia pseudosolanacearum]|nr:hypothetical protein [Ralstonia pseudosolanacearum]